MNQSRFNINIKNAIDNNNYNKVKSLLDQELKKGVPINLTSELTIAVRKGNPQIVELIHPYFEGDPKLIPKVAILREGHQYTKCIQILLDHGFTVKAKDRDMRSFMHSVIKYGDKNKIFAKLLDHGVDINLVDYETGYTMLHTACLFNQFDIVKLLIELNADINARVLNNNSKISVEDHPKIGRFMGKTCLLIAIDRGNLKLTKFLLASGANPNDDFDILATAVDKGLIELVEILLEYGANVNAVNAYMKTALHNCASKFPGHSLDIDKSKIVELLIKKGANVNATTQSGNTPLYIATMCGYTIVVEILIKYGADVFVDKNGYTLLHIALEKGYLEILMIILNVINQTDRKTFVNARDSNSQTPLHIGSKTSNANLKCIQALLSSNVNVNLIDNNGQTCLHLAAETKNLDIIELLLKNRARINIRDKNNQTALHRAAEIELQEIDSIKLLLNNGAFINAIDKNGRTALHYACDNSNLKAIEYLLQYNAKVNVKDKTGQTPLHIVFCNNSKKIVNNPEKIVKLLINHDANVSCTDSNGNTPLHYAVRYDHVEIIQLLLMAGSDVNIVNKKNRLPIDSSGRLYNHKTCRFLLNHIIKLNIAKLKLCKRNVDLCTTVIDYDEIQWIKSYERACQEEIQQMKMEKFDGNQLTYHEFLVRDISYRVNCTLNEDISLCLMSDTLSDMFPLYADILRYRFKEARKRCDIYEQIREYLSDSFIKFLPEICFNEVFHYLDIDELETFIDIIKPASARASNFGVRTSIININNV